MTAPVQSARVSTSSSRRALLAGALGGLGAWAKTGVYGQASQDSQSKGVWGHSAAGRGIQGSTLSGYAGYFAGKVFTDRYYELAEIATPPTADADRARLFIRANAAGKTQLCVRFQTGVVKVLATEA